MDEEIETQEAVTEEVEEAPAGDTKETVEEPKAEKQTETLEDKRARLQRELKQTEKKLGITKEEPITDKKTDTLDDTQLDYLDLKGITEDEDIQIIEGVMKKTGKTLREVLKDDYVTTRLEANKKERTTLYATPSSTKRGSGASEPNLDALVAKYERTRELPTDFELRSKVINALTAKDNVHVPAYKR